MTFVRALGTWWFVFGGDYVIVGLDPDYQWALVAHPSRKYGWILARTPSLPPALLVDLGARLSAQEYDRCEFVLTAQSAFRRSAAGAATVRRRGPALTDGVRRPLRTGATPCYSCAHVPGPDADHEADPRTCHRPCPRACALPRPVGLPSSSPAPSSPPPSPSAAARIR